MWLPKLGLREVIVSVAFMWMCYVGFHHTSTWLSSTRVVYMDPAISYIRDANVELKESIWNNTSEHIDLPLPAEQVARRAALQAYCNATHRQPSTSEKLFKDRLHILVDEKHRALYCLTPKAGSSSWKLMLLNISSGGGMTKKQIGFPHNFEKLGNHGIKLLSTYKQAKINKILETYMKIAVVRDPIERLLSTYRDKIAKFHSVARKYYIKVAKFIIRTYRANPSKQSLKTGETATFPEFVKYLIHIKKKEDFNEHWDTYSHLCSMCNIDYDYIVKMDSMSEDLIHLRHVLFHDSSAAVLPPQYSSPTVDQMVRDTYSAVPQDDFEKLIDIYKDDFEMFDFDPYKFYDKT